MIQFLFEAVLLSLVGGFLGLLLVYLAVFIANSNLDFKLVLSVSNLITGFLVSILVGLISGIIPAYTASRMDPVEAIRSGQ